MVLYNATWKSGEIVRLLNLLLVCKDLKTSNLIYGMPAFDLLKSSLVESQRDHVPGLIITRKYVKWGLRDAREQWLTPALARRAVSPFLSIIIICLAAVTQPKALQTDSCSLFCFFFPHRISAIKGSLLWELSSPFEETEGGKKILWKSILPVRNLRQDGKSDSLVLHLQWPTAADPPPQTKATPECHVGLDFRIYFCHVSAAWARQERRQHLGSARLCVIPVQIRNSLLPADTAAAASEVTGDHLETRCSAVCQHRRSDLTQRRVTLRALPRTGTCQEPRRHAATHARV